MDYQAFYDVILKTVMPQSFPIGVKIITKDETFPEKALRPAQFNIKIAACQWTTVARKWGWFVGVKGEDINCVPCLAGLGFKQIQDKRDMAHFFMKMGYTKSENQAVSLAESFAYRTPGEVKGIVMFPLNNVPMPPDLVIIYGMPAQMSRLVSGLIYCYGKPIKTVSNIGLSCLSALLPYWNQEPLLVIPGRGERLLAATGDTEMYLSLPSQCLNDLKEGLEVTHERGNVYPVTSNVFYELAVPMPIDELGENYEMSIPAPMKELQEKLSDPK